mgnify:CR=1 FL=1
MNSTFQFVLYLSSPNNEVTSIFCLDIEIRPERTNCIIPNGFNLSYNSLISERFPDYDITKKSLETVTISE